LAKLGELLSLTAPSVLVVDEYWEGLSGSGVWSCRSNESILDYALAECEGMELLLLMVLNLERKAKASCFGSRDGEWMFVEAAG